MKVILPVAGKGTRLLPLTRETAKPLVRVAGRPVLDYVVDKLAPLDIEEMIFITGHLKEAIEDYVTTSYDVPARFVEQQVQDGTAGAVDLARPYVRGPVMIIFVDTVFDADLSLVEQVDADGIIWAKEVEDYQRFGVVVTDESGYMQRIVEKPAHPISKLANIGLYYVRDWQTLFDGISQTLAGPQMKGEWFLTDAFQYMIDSGKKLYTAEVDGWYDCGKVETLLETNAHLLTSGRARTTTALSGVTVVDPVYVADGVHLEDCTIGPNVSIDEGTSVRSSSIKHAIVGRSCRIERSRIQHSLLGDAVSVSDKSYDWIVASRDEVGGAP
ncbi:MAG: NTP transferase domain-containing protein [Gemmatimonadota bacterium]|nr:MAG: NTP transferase domain-containing protein [Gemmatimonadota bacterium]